MADMSLKSIQAVFTAEDIKRLDALSNSIESSPDKKSKVLDQDAFMKILAAQLKYQDPLSPMKDQEFIGQMAQFNSLDAMNNLVELTKANSKTDQDMTAILASMSVGIDKLVEKLAPDENTSSEATSVIETDSKKMIEISNEMLEEMKKITEAMKAYKE